MYTLYEYEIIAMYLMHSVFFKCFIVALVSVPIHAQLKCVGFFAIRNQTGLRTARFFCDPEYKATA